MLLLPAIFLSARPLPSGWPGAADLRRGRSLFCPALLELLLVLLLSSESQSF